MIGIAFVSAFLVELWRILSTSNETDERTRMDKTVRKQWLLR